MSNNLSTLEEFDAQRKFEFPHLLYVADNLTAKKNIAYTVLAKREDEILLMSPAGFEDAAVVAGLGVANIEYFIKNAPMEYKENLIKAINNSLLFKDVWEIVQSMDEDEGDGLTRNQERVKKVIQYIFDNKVVFQV